MEDLSLIPGLGRYPGEGKGYRLQCPGLENSMGCIVHGVAESRTRLSDFHFHPDLRGYERHQRMLTQSCISEAEWEALRFEEFCGFFPLRVPFSPHLTNICYLCSFLFNWNIIALQYCVGFLSNKKEQNVNEPRDCHTE